MSPAQQDIILTGCHNSFPVDRAARITFWPGTLVVMFSGTIFALVDMIDLKVGMPHEKLVHVNAKCSKSCLMWL